MSGDFIDVHSPPLRFQQGPDADPPADGPERRPARAAGLLGRSGDVEGEGSPALVTLMFDYGEQDAPIRRGGIGHDVGILDDIGRQP